MLVSEPEDRSRFNILAGMLPKRFAEPVNTVLLQLIRPGFEDEVETRRYR